MSFAAICYKVIPGHEDEIAEIFAEGNFKRAAGEQDPENQILGTGLFIQDDTMVRIIQYRGSIIAVGAAMANQDGVKEAELKLGPYLATTRDTSTQEGFANYFRNSVMSCVFENIAQDRPATIAALRYKIRPGAGEAIAKAFRTVHPEARPTLRNQAGDESGLILAVALFVKDDTLIRMVQYEGGTIDEVARYIATREARRGLEQQLAPYAVEQRSTGTVEAFTEQFRKDNMRCISQLSIASPAVQP